MRSSILLFAFVTSWASLPAQTPVNLEDFITIGGIKQYVRIKGKDKTKPLLLFLHGGPGGSVMSYAEKFTHRLQKYFVVVQWDQRETGRTLEANSSPVKLTLALFEHDTQELIDTLLARFHCTKLYLAGHSWGTVPGFHIAATCPEVLYAYVAISPVINQRESERIVLEKMKAKARDTDNTVELDELSTVQIPFENGEQLYYHRKWLFDFGGQSFKVTKEYVVNWAATWLEVWTEASRINLMETLPAINCPVYFCIGTKDYQTNFSIVQSYYEKLSTPRKQLFWFENTAHAIPSTRPVQLQTIIIEEVLPETF